MVSKGSAGDIKLTATTGNNKIIAGNNGIDHHGSQSITLEAREANIITAGVHDENQGKEGDGIRIEGVGSVTAEANYNQILAQDVGLYIDELVTADNKETSGNITLTAHGVDAEGNGNVVLGESYGIHNSGKKDKNTEGATISVTAEIGNNVITGGASAVYNHGSGDILIQAGSINGKGVSPLYDYNDPNNVLIGRGDGDPEQVSGNGIASDSTGKTTVIAEGYNIIYGLENGIYSTNGTIDVTAGTNNIIGQYADKEGIIHTSKVGINVEAGTVNISSTSGENEIFASEKGISIAGENSSVSLNGSSNLIRVDGVGNIQSSTYGILTDAGKFTVNNEQDNKNAITNIIVNSSTGESYGINARNGGTADIYTKSIEFIVSSGFAGDETDPSPDPAESGNAYGIIAQNSVMNQTSTINISADDFININVKTRAHGAIGVGSYENNYINLISKLEDIYINVSTLNENGISGGNVYGINANKGTVNLSSGKNININLNSKASGTSGERNAINSINRANVNLSSVGAINVINTLTSTSDLNVSGLFANPGSSVTLNSDGVNSQGDGIYISTLGKASQAIYSTGSNVNVNANSGNVRIVAQGSNSNNDLYKYTYGINTTSAYSSSEGIIYNAKNVVSAMQGSIAISAIDETGGGAYGIFAASNSITDLNSLVSNAVYGTTTGIYSTGNDSQVNLNSDINTVSSDGTALRAISSAKVHLLADNVNKIESTTGIWTQSQGSVLLEATKNDFDTEKYGIYADTSSEVNFDANTDNLISVDEEAEDKKTQRGYGNGYAVYSRNASSVTIEAGNDNQLLGAVYAHGSGTNVFIGGSEKDEDKAARENRIYSYAYISGAGDLGDDPEGAFEGKNVISALYAEGGANIELSGTSNILSTYAEYENDDQLERVVWAYNGKVGEENAKGTSISIKGYSYISTNQYDKSPNSLDIAIAAGTAVGLDEDDVNTPINLEDRAKVELTYADLVNEDGSTRHSFISGDILSAYDGLVNINPKNGSNAGINIEGNLLAGNNGIVNVDLGNGGTLTGRADDYGDAGVENLNGGHQNMTFFDPAFSSKIFSGGEVNLTMGENSRWNVTGQSWITTIETSNEAISAETPIIDLITANTDRDTNAHALTIYELKGNAVFNMSLDGDRSTSDMLYIKNAQGEYTINVKDAVTVADMYANEHTGLRFATLGAGSHASFRAITWDGGVNNVEYEVDTDDYDTSTENTAYNGEKLSTDKPGDDTVDTFFGSDGEPGSTTPAENEDENIETQNLAANVKLAKAVVENADIETTAASDTLNTDATNYKLVAVKSSEISDGGKTVIDMSRANYANAVYMDTLNKRQGEARFVGNTDHGVWVRLRHDNIGKDDSFRTHNTMVEVGFEQRDVNDYGEFHTGFALDYMNGQIDYHTVDGDGDIERYGVWFYTTYLGNDGQYADLVLKYGHLKNDFGFNTRSQGEHVTGDYTNEVASISAEYGWKFSNSYNYYIEPQVQLQYSYVTGADYTTSQGSKVDLDSIHSLIGRVGFRAGKDFNTETPITAYIRGDVLHEFLGDQDIYAYDNTGVMDVTYENDDTWYSAGVGLSVQSSENTYFFIEGEQVFGADNDNTYTVSGGFKHSF